MTISLSIPEINFNTHKLAANPVGEMKFRVLQNKVLKNNLYFSQRVNFGSRGGTQALLADEPTGRGNYGVEGDRPRWSLRTEHSPRKGLRLSKHIYGVFMEQARGLLPSGQHRLNILQSLITRLGLFWKLFFLQVLKHSGFRNSK